MQTHILPDPRIYRRRSERQRQSAYNHSVLSTLLAIVGFVALWVFWVKNAYANQPSHDEVHFTQTEDGWRLALVRYKPEKATRKHPVILVHGLGANHNGFDIRPGNSYARFLTGHGYDVWILDLRGSGYSERPNWFSGKPFRWNFDDYLINDAPAAIDYVCKATGASQVHWQGHSMGGLLLYGLLALGWSDKIRSGVVTGSSLNYSDSRSDFHTYIKALWLTDIIPGIPAGLIAQLQAPIMGRIPNPFEKFNWWPDNIDAQDTRMMCATTVDAIPSGLFRQLATAMTPEGLRSFDGTFNYFERVAGATSPVLVFAGDEDRQCPPEAAQKTFDKLGSRDKKLVLLGRQYGHDTPYGHIDMLVGKGAPRDVYPHVLEWFEKYD